MDNNTYDFLKNNLSCIEAQLNSIEERVRNLETGIAGLQGAKEGFAKFKDVILVGYAVLMTLIALYKFFIDKT